MKFSLAVLHARQQVAGGQPSDAAAEPGGQGVAPLPEDFPREAMGKY